MHRALLRYAAYHPRVVIAVALAVTIAAIFFIPRIGLRLDGRSLIPAGEKMLLASDRAAASFELKDIVVVSIIAKRGSIVTREGMERLARISSTLQGTRGVVAGSVLSVATLPLLANEGGAISPDAPLDEGTIDQARVERARAAIASLHLDNGILLSADGRSAAVYAFVEPNADREALLNDAETIASQNRDASFETYIGGTALAQAELGRSVALDLTILVPFLLLTLMALMTFVFRSPVLAALSLMEIAMSLIWTVGTIGAIGGHVFITTLALPVVLLAIGVTDDIYAINRYVGGRRKGGDRPHEQIVIAAFEGVSRPIFLTACTSMAGLGSLAFTSLEPLRVFGIFGALSIGLSTLFTFSVVPAMLVLIKPKMREGSVRSNRRLAKAAIGVLGLVERVGARRMVAAVMLLAVGGVVVASHLKIDDSWIGNLDPSSSVAEGDFYINRHLAGSTTVEFGLESDRPEGFVDPAAMRTIAAMEESLATVEHVGAVQSIYSDLLRIIATLREVPYEQLRRDVAGGVVPLDRADIESALAIDATLERPNLGNYLTADHRNARITVFVHAADYERIRPLFEKADAVITSARERDEPVRSSPFGDGWISYLTVKLLVEGQIYSIAFAALADFLLVALMLRSFRIAAVAVIPVMIGVLFTFAALALTGLPLGIASSMFASIALGIGVDYSIHLAAEGRNACSRAPHLRAGLRRAYSETAPSIIVSAATITLGFGVLLLSSVVPNRMLGLLVCISLSVCAAMTLVLMPGLADMLGLWKVSNRARAADRDEAVVTAATVAAAHEPHHRFGAEKIVVDAEG